MADRLKIELKKFGERLAELRKAAGITQLDLEIRTGIGRSHISYIENGQGNIEFNTIVTLAEALDVEIVEFFS